MKFIIRAVFTGSSYFFAYNDRGDMMKERLYDRGSALLYARQWALGRNPQYYDFDGIGGDCTNFVSQCLFAGAGVMNYNESFGWFYKSLWSRSPSWTGVEFLYQFLTENKSVGPYGREVSLENLQPGDIIQLGDGQRFYHSLLVIETVPQITVAAHTDDAYNRPLASYYYTTARGIHITGVRSAS